MTDSTYINRRLRRVATAAWGISVNDETIGTVQEPTTGTFYAYPSTMFDGPAATRYFRDTTAVGAARALCEWAEGQLDDFFFDIDAIDEPEMGATHVVAIAARGSGRLIERFTTDDPYGAVEAARYCQSTPLEARWTADAEQEAEARYVTP
jgi:hypothetical protein